MSLETLIEAAKFLEHKADKKKPDVLDSKLIQSAESTSDSKSTSSNEIKTTYLHPSGNQVIALDCFNGSISPETQLNVAVKKDTYARQSKISSNLTEDANLASTAGSRSTAQIVITETPSYQIKNVSKSTTKSLHLAARNVSSESFDEGKVSVVSNMDPLFARASAAVKSPAFFSQKEGVVIHSSRSIPSTGLTLPPHGVAINPRTFSSNGAALGLQIKQSYFPVNSGLPSAGHVTILNKQSKSTATSSSDRTVSIVPSLKPVVDNKAYAALQIKPMKRSVTLTHNQLEKNRRAHLKECFEELKKAIPRLGMRRSSNLTILKAALRQIQTLKRKSANHQQILTRLTKERDEKRSKEASLLKELLKFTNHENIEKVVAELLRNGVKHSPPATSIYDTSQMSTTTASEAEEEEYRGYGEVLFQPVSSSQQALPESKVPINLVNSQLIAAPRNFDDKKVALALSARQSPTDESVGELQIVETPSDTPSEPPPPKTSQDILSTQSPPPSQRMSLSHVSAFVTKKSPIKSQSSRRSATPTPSSDFVQFFPRFSMGSGGSPPLMSSSGFGFSGDVANDRGLSRSEFVSKPPPPNKLPFSTSASNVTTSGNLFSTSKSNQREPSTVSEINENREAGVRSSKESNASNQLPRSKPQHIITATDTVLVTSYPGYEVKLKYLSTASSSIATSFDRINQARIPMKKRTFNVDSFTRHETKTPPATNAFDHQMTSLYVGASAAVLDSSTSGKMTSTSDHESDRESPFLDRKKAKFPPHWRKTLLNEQAMASESRGKVKKKTFQVHQYEISDMKTTNPGRSQNEAKRKTTTFNLWDRKHHAITPTSSRNWRGKQQLITSKPKTNTSSSTAHLSAETPSARPPSGGGSVTTVSYSQLPKSLKSAVPASLLATPIRSLSTLDGTSKQSTFTSHDDSKASLSVDASSPTAVGIQPIPNHRSKAPNNVPFPLPSNPIGYHVSSPAAVSISHSRSTSGNDPLTASSRSFSSLSSASSHASSQDSTKTTKDGLAFLQPTSQQTNSLQLSQLPCILPINYVMYPPGVPSNGMHLAALSQPPKVVTPNSLTSVQVGATRPPSKQPVSPTTPLKPPSRNQSNESASSATLSADSVDFESHKSASNSKKSRLAEQCLAPQPFVLPHHAPGLAQSQFFVPGNAGGFMVAAPTSNGFSLPFNLLGYPVQAYAGGQGYLQAVPMALPGGISPVWPVNQTVLPTVEGVSSVVTSTNNSQNNLLATSALSKID